MNLPSILIAVVIAVLVIFALISVIRSKKAGKCIGCEGGCSRCNHSCSGHSVKKG